MAKKEIRMIVASEDLAAIVDRGYNLDTDMKNKTFEDKGIKTKITESVSGQMEMGETSVKVEGKEAIAMVTAAESVELDPGAKRLPEVLAAVDQGILGLWVEKKRLLVVDQADAEKARDILVKAGVSANVTISMKVLAEALRDQNAGVFGPPEQKKALEALKESIKRDTTYRVKYERKK